jgi:mono/diheme cytochrome c family protein
MIAKISAGLAVTAVIFTACAQTNGPMAGGGEPTPPAAGTGDPVAGRTLFLHNCAHCHGANARGDDGPDLHGLDETDKWIAKRIREGKKGEMTAFAGKLQPAEIDSLIAYLHTLK